jgi:hypothetical protein
MKLIYNNIVVVEEIDTSDSIVYWIEGNTDIGLLELKPDHWIHTLKDGDMIFFNPINPLTAMYKLNVNMLTFLATHDIAQETTSKMLENIRMDPLTIEYGVRPGWTDFHGIDRETHAEPLPKLVDPLDMHYGITIATASVFSALEKVVAEDFPKPDADIEKMNKRNANMLTKTETETDGDTAL